MDSSAKRRQTNNSSGVGLDANNNPSPERRCRRSPSPTLEQLMMRREYIPLQDPRIAKLRQQEAQAPSEAIPAPSTAESSPPAMRPPEPYSLRARGTPQRQLMVQSPASVPSARFLRSQAQSPKPSPLAGSTNAGAGSSSARMEE